MHLIMSYDGAHVLWEGKRPLGVGEGEGGINIFDENIMTQLVGKKCFFGLKNYYIH